MRSDKIVRGMMLTCGVALSLVATAGPSAAEEMAVAGKNSKLELSGVGWITYRYQQEDADTLNSARDLNSFDVDRVYLTGVYTIDERYKWQTTLEATNRAGVLSLFLKKAYLQAEKPFRIENSTLWLGQFDHQFVGPMEKVWGFRSVAKLPLDEYFGLGTTLVGIGLGGKTSSGMLDWAVTVGNEKPYNKPSTTKYKTGLARVTLTPAGSEQGKQFHLMAAAQVNSDASPAADNMNTVFMLFPYWKSERMTAGLEFDLLSDKHVHHDGEGRSAADEESETHTSQNIGGFVTYQATDRIRLLGRVEQYDPDTDSDDDAFVRAIAGVARSYGKNLRGIVDLDLRSHESDELDTEVVISARAEATL